MRCRAQCTAGKAERLAVPFAALVKGAGKAGRRAAPRAAPRAVPFAASFPQLEVAFGALLQHHKARLRPAKAVRE